MITDMCLLTEGLWATDGLLETSVHYSERRQQNMAHPQVVGYEVLWIFFVLNFGLIHLNG